MRISRVSHYNALSTKKRFSWEISYYMAHALEKNLLLFTSLSVESLVQKPPHNLKQRDSPLRYVAFL